MQVSQAVRSLLTHMVVGELIVMGLSLGEPYQMDSSRAYIARQAAKSNATNELARRFLTIAAFGHFGRDDPDFTWEVVETLQWK
ncbi:hypothetical protein ACSQ67_015256 [Phaseolus vulgaris]